MGKKAVLIGCNYAGTKAELRGCVNDVKRMHSCLVDRYGFSEDDINILIDTDDSYTQPTGPDTVRVSPRRSGDDDDTGYDECIVPSDFNLINDDDFRELVDQVPHGCRITIVSDSCHSGGLIDEAKEQIGESYKNDTNEEEEDKEESGSSFGFRKFLHKTAESALESRGIRLPSGLRHNKNREEEEEVEEEERTYGDLHVKNKSLPISTLIDILKQQTGKEDIDVGKVRPTLFDMFGEDSSPKVKKFMNVLLNKLQGGEGGGSGGGGGFMGMVGSLAQEFLKQKLENDSDYAKPAMEAEVGRKEDAYAGSKKRDLPENGILISGCQTHETSADATPGGRPDQAYGALSNAIQTILESGDDVSNYKLVTQARKLLKKQGFTQNPGLYCDDNHVEASFVC
ncbi:hypothetical protein SSX86_028221 [Deinandra increscens subsp. villosa]|uniref:Peptidase C14 caspase domain-containing protein n=1 Tax=Deinandra increscens subsp. villosa TaxID=3103831 RepID=A0AAP0CE15_9ASTR